MKLQQYILFVCACVFLLFLSACNPPLSLEYRVVDRVLVEDGLFFLHVSSYCSYGAGCELNEQDQYILGSQDFGTSWLKISDMPVDLRESILMPSAIPHIVCVSNKADICYRISEKARVEISSDGGETWKVDWQIPVGRLDFIQRSPDLDPFLFVDPDTVPYDLDILTVENDHYVVVAMGNQGIVIKKANGVWEREEVPSFSKLNALGKPFPLTALSFEEAVQVLRSEIIWLPIAQILIFAYFCFAEWKEKRKLNDGVQQKKMAKRWFFPFYILIVVIIFAILLLFVFGPYEDDSFGRDLYYFVLNSIYPYFISILVLILLFLSIFVFSPTVKVGLRLTFLSIGFSILFGFFLFIPLLLWAFGFIPIYEIALVVSVLLGGLIVYYGQRTVKKFAVRVDK